MNRGIQKIITAANKLVVVTKEDHKNKKTTLQRKRKTRDVLAYQLPSGNFMLMELKPCEVRIGLADSSLKNDEGVIETVDINLDGFIFPIEVLVLEMKGLD
jgi:hypothetical protein